MDSYEEVTEACILAAARARPRTEKVIIAKYVIDGWMYLQNGEVSHFSSALETYHPRSFLDR